MLCVRDMPPPVDPAALELLARCRTESIGHHRHWGFVHGSVAAVVPGRKIVGTAVTLAVPGHDSAIVSYALNFLRPGDFLCIDRLGDRHNACWGAGTTLAAKLAGAVGVAIDGPATGSARFADFDLPAWTRGVSPVTCQMYGNGGAMNIPIALGGATILPGYAILADESGVVALPPDEVRYMANMAIDRQDGYPAAYEKLRAGDKQADMLGMTEKIEAGLAREQELRQRFDR